MFIESYELKQGGPHFIPQKDMKKIMSYIHKHPKQLLEFMKRGDKMLKIILKGEELELKGLSIVVDRDSESTLERKKGDLFPFSDKEEISSVIGLIIKKIDINIYKIIYCSYGGVYEMNPEHKFWETKAFCKKLTRNRKEKV